MAKAHAFDCPRRTLLGEGKRPCTCHVARNEPPPAALCFQTLNCVVCPGCGTAHGPPTVGLGPNDVIPRRCDECGCDYVVTDVVRTFVGTTLTRAEFERKRRVQDAAQAEYARLMAAGLNHDDAWQKSWASANALESPVTDTEGKTS